MPERWLPGSVIKPHNTDAFVPFSYGPGVCIGKPVALYNMKCVDDHQFPNFSLIACRRLLVIRILQSFKIVPAKSFDGVKFDSSWKVKLMLECSVIVAHGVIGTQPLVT